jgi:YrbI family 3-deoxy-D-manno-octulosonate 8-phosphate phosphatase
VDEAVSLLLAHPEADCVRGVVPAGQNPHKMWKIDPVSGRMNPLLAVPGIKEPYNAPRQALPPIFWQTGHVDAIRPGAILEKNSMTGDLILPVHIEGRYAVDIDSLFDLQRAEWLMYNAGLDPVDPAKQRRPLPEKIELIVFDFDGVMTDDRVWVDQDGREFVAASRSDGLGISQVRERLGIPMIVLSREENPVVAARCRKLKLPVAQGVADKETVLKMLLAERKLGGAEVVYMGNDINDLPALPLVGCFVAPADANREVIRRADLVLQKPGGFGAVRELCDMLVERNQ